MAQAKKQQVKPQEKRKQPNFDWIEGPQNPLQKKSRRYLLLGLIKNGDKEEATGGIDVAKGMSLAPSKAEAIRKREEMLDKASQNREKKKPRQKKAFIQQLIRKFQAPKTKKA